MFLGYGLACVIDILCNTMSGIGAGFLTGGGGLLFQAYDIASFCEMEVSTVKLFQSSNSFEFLHQGFVFHAHMIL